MRLALTFLRINVMNELQYRANFFLQILESLVALATGLIVLSLIFSQTSALDGWSRPQLLAVLGVFTMVGGVIKFAIEPNMGRIMADIREGTFDYVLTKPIDSQLFVSVREFRLWQLTDVFVGAAVVVWAAQSSDGSGGDNVTGSGAALGFLVSLVAGALMIYCVWLILTTGAFWFVRMEMLEELFTGLYRAGQYPVGIYPGWLRAGLTFLIPIGFAVTVPSEALTGRLTWSRLVLAVGFVVFLMALTRAIWTWGVRNYSGASA